MRQVREVRYATGKVLVRGIWWTFIGVVCLMAGEGLLARLSGVMLLLVAAAYFRRALLEPIAIRMTETDVTFAALTSCAVVRWSQVEDFVIRSRQQWLWGFLPWWRTPHLELVLDRTGTPGPGVPIRLLALAPAELEGLLKVMILASSGGLDMFDIDTGELRPSVPERPAAEEPRGFGRKRLG